MNQNVGNNNTTTKKGGSNCYDIFIDRSGVK